MELLKNLAGRVRDLRKQRGMTAKQAAEKSGLSVRFYHGLESGNVNISITRLASVAEALGVPLTDLLSTNPKRPIALLGLRGAGKSTIGPKLAKTLGCAFIELDEHIEKAANLSLPEIFNIHGEPYYRKLETRCVLDILDRAQPCVIAMPGGVVRNETAFSAIRRACTTVWLKARPEDHMRRVHAQGDRRPMANRANAMEELKNILRDRESLYEQAEITLDTSVHRIPESVRRLESELSGRGW